METHLQERWRRSFESRKRTVYLCCRGSRLGSLDMTPYVRDPSFHLKESQDRSQNWMTPPVTCKQFTFQFLLPSRVKETCILWT